MVAVGHRYFRNDIHYITYHETALTGMEGVTTLLKVLPDRVVLVRMGTVEQKLEFASGETCEGPYITSFGRFSMGVRTHALEATLTDRTGQIDICYDLTLDGQWFSANTLSISIQEEKGHGH